eukprot:12395827-Alexandrium_andersonii.AAC.1
MLPDGLAQLATAPRPCRNASRAELWGILFALARGSAIHIAAGNLAASRCLRRASAVSYTHLTLPTICSV